jgi:hypothetical protein
VGEDREEGESGDSQKEAAPAVAAAANEIGIEEFNKIELRVGSSKTRGSSRAPIS